MKQETIEIEHSMTAKQLLESKGLNPSLYLVSQEGKLIQHDEVIKMGTEVSLIPAVKGG